MICRKILKDKKGEVLGTTLTWVFALVIIAFILLVYIFSVYLVSIRVGSRDIKIEFDDSSRNLQEMNKFFSFLEENEDLIYGWHKGEISSREAWLKLRQEGMIKEPGINPDYSFYIRTKSKCTLFVYRTYHDNCGSNIEDKYYREFLPGKKSYFSLFFIGDDGNLIEVEYYER